MAKKPLMYILTGRPFAGKTSLSKAICEMKGYTYVGIDDIGAEQGIGIAGERVRQSTFEELHGIAREHTRSSLIADETVVYDSTIFRENRDNLGAMAQECGAEAITIFVDTPKEETYRRWQDNQTTHERPLMHEEQFRKFTESFEPPDSTENYIVFHGGNMHKWIANTL